MKVTILGFSHLGFVAAACAARHFQVTSLDSDDAVLDRLRAAQTPHPEPGLEELIAEGLESRRLTYSTNAILACLDADVLWVAWDPLVNEESATLDRIRAVLPNLAPGTLVLISSPLPPRSCADLQSQFPQFHFACSPWKLPRGRAIESFTAVSDLVVGIRDDSRKEVIERLFDPFTERITFMRTESAELINQTLNSRGLAAMSPVDRSSHPRLETITPDRPISPGENLPSSAS